MISTDPENAFLYGLNLLYLPTGLDENTEWLRRWQRGSGLGILANEKITPLFNNFLNQGSKGDELTQTILDIINHDITKPHMPEKPQDFKDYPEDFLAFMGAVIGLRLKNTPNNKNADAISKCTQKRLQDPNFYKMILLYEQIEDCKSDADYILQNL